MSRTKHGGYEPAPIDTIRAVIDAKRAWDNHTLSDDEYVRIVRSLLPADNFSDWNAGREAARRA